MVGSRRPRTKTDSKRQVHDANASDATEFKGAPVAGWQLFAYNFFLSIVSAAPAHPCAHGISASLHVSYADHVLTGPAPRSE